MLRRMARARRRRYRLRDPELNQLIEELIERGEFEGAVVCLPNNEAPAAAAKLASAGKHVLVEKPGAGRASDVDPVCEAVAKSGVAFQTGYMWRYDEGADGGCPGEVDVGVRARLQFVGEKLHPVIA